MHALMVRSLALLLVLASVAACGSEIGDDCSVSNDCSSNGDRFCDTSSEGGYCTIIGCDVRSCPEESICVRFFTDVESNRVCDAATEDRAADACSADELCTIGGSCVPRGAEIRFCMRSCSSDGDCRDGYECRDAALMKEHGGEPVPPAGETLDDDPARFCAAAPISIAAP
jgi:hypothetical protein